MKSLSVLYRPITASPYRNNESYAEYPPCDALAGFVVCFWGTCVPGTGSHRTGETTLVIPDTCMDVLVEVNHTRGELRAWFTGIQDKPFQAREARDHGDLLSTFAVRFPFWAVHRFAGGSLRDGYNHMMDLAERFPHWQEVLQRFFTVTGIEERIRLIEPFLLRQITGDQGNHHVLNAVYHILRTGGSRPVGEVCGYAAVSQRQLERLFREHIGISVKTVSSLVRHQCLWRELAFSGGIDIQDAVLRYGFTDQSHLLNSFRGYHGVSPTQALEYARRTADVVFLQDKPCPDFV